MEMNLDCAHRSDRADRRPGDRLHRPDHLQQRDLADGVRRAGPGRGADLLLPEGRHRHLERLRHRQRHADQRHRRRAGGQRNAQLSRQRRRTDRAGGSGVDRHSADHQPGRRADTGRSSACNSTWTVHDSTVHRSASPTCRRTAMPPARSPASSIEDDGVADGALQQRPEQAGRTDRAGHLPQPARPAGAGRQRLGAQLHHRRPDRRCARPGQPGRAASRVRSKRATST